MPAIPTNVDEIQAIIDLDLLKRSCGTKHSFLSRLRSLNTKSGCFMQTRADQGKFWKRFKVELRWRKTGRDESASSEARIEHTKPCP